MEKGDLKINNKTVVHCKTKELAKQVLAIAHNLRYKWITRDSYMGFSLWDICKEKTCYAFNRGSFFCFNFYSGIGYKIIEAKDFIKLHK